MRASTLELEVGLGPLLRGEVRATELRLVAPQIRLGLDRYGAVDWPSISPSFSPDGLAVSHLTIDDGQVVLTDAVSGSRLVLQKLWFNGDVRSFGGPFKGEGAFVAGDQLYGYRIAAIAPEEGGALKLRVAVDPAGYPLTAEIEGTLRLDRGMPQFDGTLAARPVTAALARGERVMSDPWRLAGKLRRRLRCPCRNLHCCSGPKSPRSISTARRTSRSAGIRVSTAPSRRGSWISIARLPLPT